MRYRQPATMSTTTANDSEEYYCFRVKEGIGEAFDKENIVIIPRSYNFDLKKLRTELWKQFGVPRDRRIFYIDDDGDDVPIDSECEFHEALKLAKNAFMVNTAIPLIVGTFHVPTSCSDEQCSGTSEICCPNKESRNVNGNPASSFTEKSDGSMPEPNSEFDKQKRSTRKVPSNQRKLHIKRCDESSDEQTELEDVEIPKVSNTPALRCYSDTVSPPWFTEYMEVMKKDMVSTITHEVVKNVTEVLNKRLDSFVHPLLKVLDRSRNQSYSSLSKRHPRCFDSNEKNQKRMRSQDEEQSSDASIERVDEPQNVNIAEDPQMKKDVISTISREVVKEMTDMLNSVPLTSAPSKKHNQSRSQSHLRHPKELPTFFDIDDILYFRSSEKNQRKMRPQDGEQSSDDACTFGECKCELRNATTADNVSRQAKPEEIKKALHEKGIFVKGEKKEEKGKRKKKCHQRTAPVITDNLNSDIGKEQSQNNAREDFPIPRKNTPQTNPIPYDETLGMLENELRMSCSVTGHQILDEGRRRDVWCCNNSDIDKTSFWSCDQEEEDDDAFEIIQMPASENRDDLIIHFEEPAAEQRRHDSNRDSPSFELLSEPPSPTSFMHFNEEHFSTNEGNPEQQTSQFADTSPPTSGSIYVVDVHGKIYNEHQSADLNERVNADLEKRSGGAYSFVAETLPAVQDTRCSKSSRSEQRSEWKNPRDDVGCDSRDNASSSYDDVRNSHTSYLTVRTHCDSKTQSQCSCQTDSNDLTQSFHSHTTSVTDTTDIYTEAYGIGKYEQVMTAKDVLETATTKGTATATATATAASRNDQDAGRVGSSCAKETKTNERHCHGGSYPECTYCSIGSCCVKETKTNERHCHGGNYPECTYCANSTPQGTSVDPPYQSSGRASGSSSKSTNERHCHAGNYPEYAYCTNSTPQGASVDPPHQSSGRASGSSSKSSSNVGSRKASIGEQTADPVRILPETLVTAAAHVVGSFAYDTAREVLDKIRGHTKEDFAKRRGGAKCDDKKRFFVSPLSLY